MKITKKYLVKIGACSKGIDEFLKLFPKGFDTKDWILEKQIEILKTPFWNYAKWAIDEKLLPMWSFSGVNLYRVNFYEADLTETNFTGANFYKANFYKADLTEANFTGANFSMVDLYRANFYKANFSRASFYETNLYEANFTEANFTEANFYRADFTEAVIDIKWKDFITKQEVFNFDKINWIK